MGEGKPLLEKVAGTVSREKVSFCCDKEAGRRLQRKVEREIVPISKCSYWALWRTPTEGAEVSQVAGAKLGRKQGWQACPWGKEAVPEEEARGWDGLAIPESNKRTSRYH